jgi:hypothetical protein
MVRQKRTIIEWPQSENLWEFEYSLVSFVFLKIFLKIKLLSEKGLFLPCSYTLKMDHAQK